MIDMDYERFENDYVVTADFNSTETIFEFDGERLTLNFENNTQVIRTVNPLFFNINYIDLSTI